jgi:peptide chain release factor 1
MNITPGLAAELERLRDRHREVAALLAEPGVLANAAQFRALSREYARLEDLVATFHACEAAEQRLAEADELRQDPEPALRALAMEEAQAAQAELVELKQQLQRLLLPPDPFDASNVFLEIRAGTGGDEAALFAGDLFRMYSRYAERRGWQVEIISQSEGEHGGFKEIICRLIGEGVYSRLKFESGTHRVQRIPATESQGRIHTSACTVAVLPEVEAVADLDINPADLRIDTFRASGAGGQHVNKTDSAVRFTHLPSGIVVECQDERSQHKNRAKALSLLKARLLAQARETQHQQTAEQRRALVGSGDRSERIRTYNYPQGRLTDHRINLTLYRLEAILDGDLDEVLNALQDAHQSEQLAALGA